MDKEAVKDFLRDTREKRLAIAAAKERIAASEAAGEIITRGASGAA